MNTRYFASLLVTGMLSSTAYSANIVDNGNTKAVNQVRWHKQTDVDVQQLINQPIPQNATNVIFLRRADNDPLQSSANIAINDRFQVSIQPNNFSRVYSCSGVNQISGDITGNKNNNLLKNALTFKLEPNTTYFFDVDVDNQGQVTIKHMTQDSALTALKGMKYQSHQITRVVPNCPVTPEPIVPPVATVTPAPKPNYESMQLKILFADNKSAVNTQYYEEIKQVAEFMSRHPEVTATIEGHTDDRASDDYNVALSQRRVDAVKNVLIKQYGIQANRLNSVGYGESRPIASNDSEEGRQQNRRVVVVFEAN